MSILSMRFPYDIGTGPSHGVDLWNASRSSATRLQASLECIGDDFNGLQSIFISVQASMTILQCVFSLATVLLDPHEL